ncbi:MAG: nucleotide pyrophosphohydrolase [Elusimicrobia bacterium GWA2_61_42]|nr:MAG: nucleotide pyrophosphohydrolase [Elusimicrobia bacterium GWA2_61_42]OGR75723.1 MAG: nucleotide pyrophosphohydrolase [Elusimicrobia bacterium GWC2_61_25]
MKTINDLTKKIIAFRDARDWKQFHNPKDVAISLALEAAELLEHFQWKNPEEIARHVKARKLEVSEELADVLYWVLLLAHDLDIDLGSAAEKKLLKNAKKYPVAKSKGRHTKYTRL